MRGFAITNGLQRLHYVGGDHFSDPGASQRAQLQQSFDRFVHITAPETSVVAVEASYDRMPVDEAEALAQRGETGLIVSRSRQHHYPVIRPDPKLAEQFAEMQGIFGHEEAALYVLGRDVWQWHHTYKRKISFEKYAARQTLLYRGTGLVLSASAIEELGKEVFGPGRRLDYEDEQFWNDNLWPSWTDDGKMIASNDPLKRIGAPLLAFRDERIKHGIRCVGARYPHTRQDGIHRAIINALQPPLLRFETPTPRTLVASDICYDALRSSRSIGSLYPVSITLDEVEMALHKLMTIGLVQVVNEDTPYGAIASYRLIADGREFTDALYKEEEESSPLHPRANSGLFRPFVLQDNSLAY